ncbi:MAG TPA: Uma2 family endonuclease [Solirubrobacteraceae bacterium]
MAIDAHVHRFTNAEFERMANSGVFEDLRVELLDGLPIDVAPPREPHVRVIQRLMRLFASRIELVRIRSALSLAEGWVPEPDVALVEHGPDPTRWPTTALLAVEVSLTTHAIDHRKAFAYARGGVPRYWLVDLPANIVLDHTEPGPDGYAVVRRLAGDDVLDVGVDGIETTTVAELLTL